MKDRIELWNSMHQDLGMRYPASTVELERDCLTVSTRFRHEGGQFFTVTLPQFGKDFEQVLRNGEISDDLFVGWSRKGPKTKHRVTPRFLGSFMDRVVDSTTGRVLDIPCSSSVFAVRQLTLAFGKLKELCAPDLIGAEKRRYIETDKSIHCHLEKMWADPDCDVTGLTDNLRQVMRVVFGGPLSVVDESIYRFDVIPKHGPGATADKLRGNMKFKQSEWTCRMEPLFPYSEYAVPSRDPSLWKDVDWLDLERERLVSITAVPKDAKRPRLIAEEPTCMQYMQQAVSRALTSALETPMMERDINPSSFLVGFEFQWPNQAMAQIGSDDGSLATLDLSEASDRIPNWLVEEVFLDFPWFSEALQVTRSLRADVGSFGQVTLSKFASMGSALTFPIEAIIFAAIAVKCVLHGSVSDTRPVAFKDVLALKDTVRVYGDDIIVPTESAVAVAEGLETFGFVVNSAKSFWTGMFRESCGKEFFNGDDVSIVRFRKDLPTKLPPRHRDASEIISAVETRNQMLFQDLDITVSMLDRRLESILQGCYPVVALGSPILGRVRKDGMYEIHDIEPDTQSPLTRGFVVDSKIPRNAASNYAALMKCLLLSTEKVAEDHLERSGRPHVVGIKRGKARPH